MFAFVKFFDKFETTVSIEDILNLQLDCEEKLIPGLHKPVFWSPDPEETIEDVRADQGHILQFNADQLSGGKPLKAGYYPATILAIANSEAELKSKLRGKRLVIPTLKAQELKESNMAKTTNKNSEKTKKKTENEKALKKIGLKQSLDKLLLNKCNDDGEISDDTVSSKEVKNKIKHAEEEITTKFEVQLKELKDELSSVRRKNRRLSKELEEKTRDNEKQKVEIERLRDINFNFQTKLFSSNSNSLFQAKDSTSHCVEIEDDKINASSKRNSKENNHLGSSCKQSNESKPNTNQSGIKSPQKIDVADSDKSFNSDHDAAFVPHTPEKKKSKFKSTSLKRQMNRSQPVKNYEDSNSQSALNDDHKMKAFKKEKTEESRPGTSFSEPSNKNSKPNTDQPEIKYQPKIDAEDSDDSFNTDDAAFVPHTPKKKKSTSTPLKRKMNHFEPIIDIVEDSNSLSESMDDHETKAFKMRKSVETNLLEPTSSALKSDDESELTHQEHTTESPPQTETADYKKSVKPHYGTKESETKLKTAVVVVPPGSGGDSLFIKQMAGRVFTTSELLTRSVTGTTVSPKKKVKGKKSTPKPPLSPTRLNYMRQQYKERLQKSAQTNEEYEARKKLFNYYMNQKIGSLLKAENRAQGL